MELMNQPFTGQLGNCLIELLDSQDYHTLNIVVAFAKNSGVLRIKDSLARFRERGGTVNAYVGIDLGGTSYEALTALLLHTNSLNVVHSEIGQTFHAKIYQFLGKDKGLLVVGSHNLTGGGLWTNFESSVFIPIDRTSANKVRLVQEMDDYIGQLTSLKDSCMPIGNQSDIEQLLQNGYIVKEVAQQVRQAKAAAQDETRERLFGNGVPAKLPQVAVSEKEGNAEVSEAPEILTSAPLSNEGQTIWFESRLMTGGSRNILDLSMTSLVERGDPKGTSFDFGSPTVMRGGVEFFGLDHKAIDQTKNITLNFEGVDYTGNTILFPSGQKANGSWRLQIKGRSSNMKITDVFAVKAEARGEEYYLVEKVITFTRIQDDYYSMSVFPESELENFEAASRILARNGSIKVARRLGLL